MDTSSSLADGVPPAKPDAAHWFAVEVHPHETQLRSFLHGRFPAVRDVDDVVQESYLRIWRARAAHPIQSAKAFLFTIARHLALDALHRDRRISDWGAVDFTAVQVPDEKPGPADLLSYDEKVCLLAEVLAALPDRCREIVILRKLKGLSQREVAAQLGLSERTVENQLGRGIRRCELSFRRLGVRSLFSR